MDKLKEYDFKKYNISILLVVMTLGAIGSYLIKQVQTDGENLFKKQIIGLLMGIIIAIIVSIIDYHFISKFFVVLYIINLVLLALVKTNKFGVSINYARRWLKITEGFQFQPSELSKVILIIFLAKLLIIVGNKISNIFILLITLFLLAVPTVLILTQTDLSTSMVLMFVFLTMIFTAGLSYKIVLPVLIIGIPVITGTFWYVQQDYQVLLSESQQMRVLSILNPEMYPDVMWQQDNSTKAIGSGQLYGKLLSDDEDDTRGYSFVPISESDFIFSVAGEEFGFIGSLVIISIYTLLVFFAFDTARKARDDLGKYIAIGIASMLLLQIFINIGVATALLPNTGIPLPFLSYGLSSLVSGMIAIGLIINIRLQRK